MKVLITGGCGFIGCNAAERHLHRKDKVYLIDNLSRLGTDRNLKWLKEEGKFTLYKKDIRDQKFLTQLLKKEKFDLIYHFAGQVAVTTSVVEPRNDFEINALGTLNVLEAMRVNKSKSTLIYASTNKVYGEMLGVNIQENENNVRLDGYPNGISENFNLDFHSPYGCSKGSADQYVRDYHRLYGLNTVVFRQSCIYGERQFGIEDQGWVAHFIIQSLFNRPLKIYGDGKQVRDVLYVGDLLDAYDCASKNKTVSSGKIYNMGGGIHNQLSLKELIQILGRRLNKNLKCSYFPIRPGDQRIFVADTSLIGSDLRWSPKTSLSSGIEKLFSWVEKNIDLFK